jgi:hemerythrin
VAIHVEALKSLSTEDFNEIHEEHLRLNNSLTLLCATCHNLNNELDCKSCDRQQWATCQGRLISFFYNVINFSSTHFKHEESIMLRQANITKDDVDYLRHRQAHVDMLTAMDVIISECALLDASGKTDEAYRQLCKRMSLQFKEHDRIFDRIY